MPCQGGMLEICVFFTLVHGRFLAFICTNLTPHEVFFCIIPEPFIFGHPLLLKRPGMNFPDQRNKVMLAYCQPIIKAINAVTTSKLYSYLAGI